MDSTSYTTLTRQSGLKNEIQSIANNIANMSTAGFRREGLIFSEFVAKLDKGEPSLSMAHANVRMTSSAQGALTPTGGTLDFAIEGDGFFMLETPDGQALSRAGSFSTNAEGELVNYDGYRVLDNGGSPIFIPVNAQSVNVASDGAISIDGVPAAQLGVYTASDPTSLSRSDGVLFYSDAGYEPVETSNIVQGFIEQSNVNAITEIARMIEVQRAYETGQNFLEKEDERIRSVLSTLGR